MKGRREGRRKGKMTGSEGSREGRRAVRRQGEVAAPPGVSMAESAVTEVRTAEAVAASLAAAAEEPVED